MSLSKKLTVATAFLATLTLPAIALADGGGAASNEFDTKMAYMVGAGVALGLAALGGTLGQGRAVAAALEGIARNPGAATKIQTPMILGLALIESLVLVAFALAFVLKG